MTLTFNVLAGTLAIHRLKPDSPIPPHLLQQNFVCLVKTPDELSIVVDASVTVPSQHQEFGWRGLFIQGTLAFEMTGILAAIASILAEANISLFAISTYDTDYILVKDTAFDAACLALQRQGHIINTN